MNILVVDDSLAMRMIVKKTLRGAGYDGHKISEAADGAIAYEAITKSTPDVVLCDWNMPNMNGIDLLQKLNDEGYKTKFGFVTTEATPDMRAKAKDAGARFLIAKPFTTETFKEALDPILN